MSSRQPQPLRDYWKGYRAAAADIDECGIQYAESRHSYGTGGTPNYWRGYAEKIRRTRAAIRAAQTARQNATS